jgi:hypothetical protein
MSKTYAEKAEFTKIKYDLLLEYARSEFEQSGCVNWYAVLQEIGKEKEKSDERRISIIRSACAIE